MKGKVASILIVLLFLNLLAWGALTQLRQVAIFNSTIDATVIGGTGPANGTFTDLKSTLGISNDGAGWKHKRFTSCTTAAAAGAFCQTNFTWNTPFADTSYTMLCAVQSGTLFVGAINNKTAAGAAVIVELTPGNSAAASTELDCVGFHDAT
jgi:hypothetical protein